MIPFWLEILGSFLVIIFGLVYLLRVIYSHKAGRKIWKSYSSLSEKEDLDVKKSLNILSNWPNLYGEVNGKEVYVHPNRGKRKSPSKTIFAVETDIDLSDDMIIATSEAEVPEDTHELDAQNLKKYKYKVYSKGKYGDEFIENLFSKKASKEIAKLIERNEETFRAMIFEDGLAMYSTFGIDVDEESISTNLEELSDVVKEIEKNISRVSEGLRNQRMAKIGEGTSSTVIKGIFSSLLFVIGGYLFYQISIDFSFLLLNIATLFAIIGSLKLYVLVYTSWKYQ